MLSRDILRGLLRGLRQQLWFFGRDTIHPDGNLLQEYGFERFKLRGQPGSHRYRAEWKGHVVELHSFCVGIYRKNADGFLYVRANDRMVVYEGDVPPFPGRYSAKRLVVPVDRPSKSRFHEASSRFLEWLESYENWLESKKGLMYRVRNYFAYHRPWLFPSDAMTWFETYRTDPAKLQGAIVRNRTVGLYHCKEPQYHGT